MADKTEICVVCALGGGDVGLESHIFERGVTQTVTFCHRRVEGCQELAKIASRIL